MEKGKKKINPPVFGPPSLAINRIRLSQSSSLLKSFGSPVQYSIFKCLLTNEEIIEMKGRVKKLIRPKADHVRYYRLCKACKSKTEVMGRVEVLAEKDVIVV
ncbi:MAG: CRISPR-associated endonuclease Cas2 [Anaerolineaceae bacterium]